MEWISVKDRLPATGQKVLLFANGVVQEELFQLDTLDVSYCSACPAEFCWSREDIDDSVNIESTHKWMPLPSPPGMEEALYKARSERLEKELAVEKACTLAIEADTARIILSKLEDIETVEEARAEIMRVYGEGE